MIVTHLLFYGKIIKIKQTYLKWRLDNFDKICKLNLVKTYLTQFKLSYNGGHKFKMHTKQV